MQLSLLKKHEFCFVANAVTTTDTLWRLAGPQLAKIFGGQNDCNLLLYLTKKVIGAFKMFSEISGEGICPVYKPLRLGSAYLNWLHRWFSTVLLKGDKSRLTILLEGLAKEILAQATWHILFCFRAKSCDGNICNTKYIRGLTERLLRAAQRVLGSRMPQRTVVGNHWTTLFCSKWEITQKCPTARRASLFLHDVREKTCISPFCFSRREWNQ